VAEKNRTSWRGSSNQVAILNARRGINMPINYIARIASPIGARVRGELIAQFSRSEIPSRIDASEAGLSLSLSLSLLPSARLHFVLHRNVSRSRFKRIICRSCIAQSFSSFPPLAFLSREPFRFYARDRHARKTRENNPSADRASEP